MQFAYPGEDFFAALNVPCLSCINQLPPQLLLAVKFNGMAPSGLNSQLVSLWFGELVAFMRDRTLDEGNDLS